MRQLQPSVSFYDVISFSYVEEIESLLLAKLNYMAQRFPQIDNLSIKSAF
jgi:hypothetical protein